ncbi:tetratricopeptide repeat protein [Dokdonia sp. Hel_I_53]|nr:tetratricopeptide repeat protein [Dokdonia sp. Hel_I_53]
MIKWILLFLIPFLSFGQEYNAFAKAESLYKAGKYQKAKPIFESYLKSHPNNLRVIEYLGDIEGYAKRWDAAIPYYKTLIEKDVRNPDYHYKYGGVLGMKALEVNKFTALTMIGDIKEAFEMAATLDPKHIEVRWALVEFYIQLPSIVGGSIKKAQNYADELLRISEVDGYLAHGHIADYNDNPKDAERFFKKALSVGGSVTCYEKLSDHYEKNGVPEKSQSTLKKAQEVHKTSNRLHYQFGKIAGQYGIGLDQGIACLNQYIKNYTVKDSVPKDWAYFRLAQIYKHKGDKEAALSWINKALSDRNNFKEAIAEKKKILSI